MHVAILLKNSPQCKKGVIGKKMEQIASMSFQDHGKKYLERSEAMVVTSDGPRDGSSACSYVVERGKPLLWPVSNSRSRTHSTEYVLCVATQRKPLNSLGSPHQLNATRGHDRFVVPS